MPGWLKFLFELVADVFLGFMREQAREEIRDDLERETDALTDAVGANDDRPVDGRDALERLRRRRLSEDGAG